jgi:hypothetical protein
MKESFKEWEPSDMQVHDTTLYTILCTLIVLVASFPIKAMMHGEWPWLLHLILCIPAAIVLLLSFRYFFLKMFYFSEK